MHVDGTEQHLAVGNRQNNRLTVARTAAKEMVITTLEDFRCSVFYWIAWPVSTENFWTPVIAAATHLLEVLKEEVRDIGFGRNQTAKLTRSNRFCDSGIEETHQ